MNPIVLSIQLSLPKTLGSDTAELPHDKLWTTGFFKTPVTGGQWVHKTGITGDGQADLENHGGVDKAVLAYSADHYARWRADLADIDPASLESPWEGAHPSPLKELLSGKDPLGSFGENLSIAGCDETQVCIGDTWRSENIVFQVSQPRQPCWKLSRRWRISDLAKRVIQNGRCGWYFRVLVSGVIEPNSPIFLDARPFPQWTVARAHEVMHHGKADLQATAELAAVPLLSATWRKTLSDRLSRRPEKPDFT